MATNTNGFRFGPYVVERPAYRVLRNGQALTLSPKLVDLLLYFVSRPSVLVTKDQLFAAIWPDVTVTENALTQAISDLRQALGDDPSSPTYIQTVARRGYRFIAPVEAIKKVSNAPPPIKPLGSGNTVTKDLEKMSQLEFEAEIDEVNRGIHLAALLFILLGAAIGVWMAERIADLVRRVTRATRRVGRGDFDARILVRSSDELQRLVDAFNSMAGELKAQARQLERTHRLEAWAEMARQVAHEIKNPLTPIRLSAEHLRRVHADRGAPLAPVLEGCVESILRQVDLLRQIAGEFSSFASEPVPRPAPVVLADLLNDVVAPYRVGLAGRIRLDLVFADAPD